MKFKILMLDANVIIDAHKYNFWNDLINRYEVHVPTIILNEVKYFDDLSGKRHNINLKNLSLTNKIIESAASADEIAQIINRSTKRFRDTIHPGELEALAILNKKDIDYRFCTGDKAAIKALSALELGSFGVSLEEVLEDIGQRLRLPQEIHQKYSKINFKALLGEGFAEKDFLIKNN